MAIMLTTVEAVKTQLGITGTADDDRIEFYIRAVSATIENYCKRQFSEQDYEHTFQPTYTDHIFAEEYPVREITKVTYGEEELDPADYSFENGGIFKTEGTWNRETTIEYTAGYVLPGDEDLTATPPIVRDLPYDLEAAAIFYATINYNTTNSAGIKSEQVDVLRVQYGDGNVVGGKVLPLPATVMAMVNPYRHGGRLA